MPRVCALTGKRTKAGNNKPFSQKRTKRTFKPNLFKVRITDPITGQTKRIRLSAKAIRTLKKWEREAVAELESTVVQDSEQVDTVQESPEGA